MKKWEDIDNHLIVATEDIDNHLIVATKEELLIVDTLSFLEAQRIKEGTSQTKFAKRIGMTQPQLAKIEALESILSLATAKK